eukprot:TRINITY_DN21288_c0_g1_i3.p1 TRINITY_DN21288_c0_g1~~TRINITY_DN21288_c0_g1_i3.p1  ORF type:complete len:373 (+),score=75.09 TRINITY_DN21288_c0_g1_i3:54-1121(+)
MPRGPGLQERHEKGATGESDEESSAEHDGSDVAGDDFDNLDEWGWDPMVDEFLLDTVEEALQYGPRVDFAWVAAQFLEVCAPDDSKVEEAMERFSPAALQDRWLYLVARNAQMVAVHEDRSQSEESASFSNVPKERVGRPAATGGFPAAATGSRSSASASSAWHAAPAAASVLTGAPEAAASSLDRPTTEAAPADRLVDTYGKAGPPKRDRVLEAMQNFLWGQPNPSRNPGKPLPPTAKAHPQEPDGRSMPVSDTPPGQGGLLSLADTVDVSCHADSMAAAIAAGAALAPLSSGSACPEHTSMALASGSPPSTNEALRRCLEALRWHGEAAHTHQSLRDVGITALCRWRGCCFVV